MVPNEFQFVCDVIGPRLAIIGTEDDTRHNTFEAVNDGCVQIRGTDPRWGLLIKTGGAMVDNRAADVWLYDLGDGTAQVVDVVGNSEGAAPPEGGPRTPPVPSWAEKDIRQISEWAEPYPRYDGGTTPEPPPGGDLEVRVTALEVVTEGLAGEVDDHTTRIAALEAALADIESRMGRARTHGAVNLPCVVEDITHLRAKGDIDVPVRWD